MNREMRDVALALEMRGMPGAGAKLVGYGAVFNSEADIGHFREVITPGAFKRTLKNRRNIHSFFNHNPDNLLGSTAAGSLSIAEDETGLRYELVLDDTDIARRVYRYVETNEVTGSSFAFSVPKGGDVWDYRDSDLPLRSVNEAILYELGPVVTPAYEDTTVNARASAEVAFRSLAETSGRSLGELISAAEAGELPRLLVPEDRAATTEPDTGAPSAEDSPGPVIPSEPLWKVRARRELDLIVP